MKIKGFTLIELLVVVLIIGILAAVAMPQYTKAVEKARATQVYSIVLAFSQAQDEYFMANGFYAAKFADLNISLPVTGTKEWKTGNSYISDTVSNDDWSFQMWHNAAQTNHALFVGRLRGKYKGAGFLFYFPSQKMNCGERLSAGIVFDGQPGDYCIKIFKGTATYEDNSIREYSLPEFSKK